jgi:hypothetical protein
VLASAPCTLTQPRFAPREQQESLSEVCVPPSSCDGF